MGMVPPISAGAPNNAYHCHPDHRNGNLNKSQWTITQVQELDAFRYAEANKWLDGAKGWGLHLVNGAAQYLGISVSRVTQLFVAEFVAGNAPVLWHGYPANHQAHAQDIPHAQVLKDWMKLNLVAAPKIRKLMRGQPCSL